MTGEELYGLIEQALANVIPGRHGLIKSWYSESAFYQQAYTNAAIEITLRFGDPSLSNLATELLKKYGRHLPTCPAGAACVCGFAEIENQLKAA